MKSQRRHELEHNALLDWLATTYKQAEPYLNLVLGIVVAAALVVFGYSWWSRQAAGQTAEAWDRFYQAQTANNPVEFEKVAESYPGTHVGQYAAVNAADLRLIFGLNQRFSNQAGAMPELRKAVGLYLMADESSSPMLRQRATFGLARAYEGLGDLEKAIQYYRQLTEKWPKGAYDEVASHALTQLQKPETKAWFDRFAKYDPKPAFTDEPGKKPVFNLDTFKEPAAPKIELKQRAPEGATSKSSAGGKTEAPPKPGAK